MLASHVTSATVLPSLPLLQSAPPRTSPPPSHSSQNNAPSLDAPSGSTTATPPFEPSPLPDPISDGSAVSNIADENEAAPSTPVPEPSTSSTVSAPDQKYESADPLLLHAIASMRGAVVNIKTNMADDSVACGIFTSISPDLRSILIEDNLGTIRAHAITDLEFMSAYDVDLTSLITPTTSTILNALMRNGHGRASSHPSPPTPTAHVGTKFMTDPEIAARNKGLASQFSPKVVTSGAGHSRRRSQYGGNGGTLGPDGGKELQPWEDDGDVCDEDAIGGGDSNSYSLIKSSARKLPNDFYTLDNDSQENGWEVSEMFATNERCFGLKSTYHDDLTGYTTPLEVKDTPEFKEAQARAAKMAAEIESSVTYQRHIALEDDDDERELSGALAGSGSGKKKLNNTYGGHKQGRAGSLAGHGLSAIRKHSGRFEDHQRYGSNHGGSPYMSKGNTSKPSTNVSLPHRKTSGVSGNKTYNTIVGVAPNVAPVTKSTPEYPVDRELRGHEKSNSKTTDFGTNIPSLTISTGYQNKFYNSKMKQSTSTVTKGQVFKNTLIKDNNSISIPSGKSDIKVTNISTFTNNTEISVPTNDIIKMSNNESLEKAKNQPILLSQEQSPYNRPSTNISPFTERDFNSKATVLVSDSKPIFLDDKKIKSPEETLEPLINTSGNNVVDAEKILKSSKLNPNALSFVPNFKATFAEEKPQNLHNLPRENSLENEATILASYTNLTSKAIDVNIVTPDQMDSYARVHQHSAENAVVDYTGACYYQNLVGSLVPNMGVSAPSNIHNEYTPTSDFQPLVSAQIYNPPRSMSPAVLSLGYGQAQYDSLINPTSGTPTSIPNIGMQQIIAMRQGANFNGAALANNNMDSPHKLGQQQFYILVQHPSLGNAPFGAHSGPASSIFNIQQAPGSVPRFLVDPKNIPQNNVNQYLGNPSHPYVAVGQPLQQAIIVQTPSPSMNLKPVPNPLNYEQLNHLPNQNPAQPNQYSPYISLSSGSQPGSGYVTTLNPQQQHKIWVVPGVGGAPGYMVPYHSQQQIINPAVATTPLYRPLNAPNSSPFPLMNLPSQYHQMAAHNSGNLNGPQSPYPNGIPIPLPNFPINSSLNNTPLPSPINNPNIPNSFNNQLNMVNSGDIIPHDMATSPYKNSQHMLAYPNASNKSHNHGELRHPTTHHYMPQHGVGARNHHQAVPMAVQGDRRSSALATDFAPHHNQGATAVSAYNNNGSIMGSNVQPPPTASANVYGAQVIFSNGNKQTSSGLGGSKISSSPSSSYRGWQDDKRGTKGFPKNSLSAKSTTNQYSANSAHLPTTSTLMTDPALSLPNSQALAVKKSTNGSSNLLPLPPTPTLLTTNLNSQLSGSTTVVLRGCSSDAAIAPGKSDLGLLSQRLHKSLSLNVSPHGSASDSAVNGLISAGLSLPATSPNVPKTYVNYPKLRNNVVNSRYRPPLINSNLGSGSLSQFRKVLPTSSYPHIRHLGNKDQSYSVGVTEMSPPSFTMAQSLPYLSMPPPAQP